MHMNNTLHTLLYTLTLYTATQHALPPLMRNPFTQHPSRNATQQYRTYQQRSLIATAYCDSMDHCIQFHTDKSGIRVKHRKKPFNLLQLKG